MKLLHCLNCTDIVALTTETRKCQCGRSEGRYSEKHVVAEYSGPSLLLGIENKDLLEIQRQVEQKFIKPFVKGVWVTIDSEASTVRKLKELV